MAQRTGDGSEARHDAKGLKSGSPAPSKKLDEEVALRSCNPGIGSAVERGEFLQTAVSRPRDRCVSKTTAESNRGHLQVTPSLHPVQCAHTHEFVHAQTQ